MLSLKMLLEALKAVWWISDICSVCSGKIVVENGQIRREKIKQIKFCSVLHMIML